MSYMRLYAEEEEHALQMRGRVMREVNEWDDKATVAVNAHCRRGHSNTACVIP